MARAKQWMRTTRMARPADEAEKRSILAACEAFFSDVLKPRFHPQIRPTEWNYVIDIPGAWEAEREISALIRVARRHQISGSNTLSGGRKAKPSGFDTQSRQADGGRKVFRFYAQCIAKIRNGFVALAFFGISFSASRIQHFRRVRFQANGFGAFLDLPWCLVSMQFRPASMTSF